MKIKRNTVMEGSRFEVNDIISFELDDGEPVEAMAVKQEGENMIFCLLDCLRDEYPMNTEPTNKGGYEMSDMRKTLRDKILPRFPEEIRKKLVPFENGDLLRLPTEKEIFGKNECGAPESDKTVQWEPMKLWRNKIALQGSNGVWEWYWLQNPLRDVASATYFAYVYGIGTCGAYNASNPLGVRPAFQILNL